MSFPVIDEKERHHKEYQAFYEWYMRAVRSQGTCFERDILRENKAVLWNTWKTLAEDVG